MGISKAHPCNSLGWLFVEPNVAATAMQRQLALRDAELAIDRHASGEPAAFKAWSIAQIKGIASKPGIAQQVQERRQRLQKERQRLRDRLALTVAAAEAEAQRLDEQLALLDQLEAA